MAHRGRPRLKPFEPLPEQETLCATNWDQHKADFIIEAIRAGNFEKVAVDASGLDPQTYKAWMMIKKEPYRTFQTKIRQAKAQARMYAENKVFSTNPLAWLKQGPGKSRPDYEGWTDLPPQKDADEVTIVTSPEFQNLQTIMAEVLEAFPEAKKALAARLSAMSGLSPTPPLPPPIET